MHQRKEWNRAIGRRRLLAALTGAGAAAVFIPAWNETVEAADTITCVPAAPSMTEGPYWVDEKLFRSDIRTDPTTGITRTGIPLTLKMTLQNLSGSACAALAGAYVDVWHCDAKGIYSDESTYNPGGGTGAVNTTGQKFLRGYQISDGNGEVTFQTIYPGWYSGRTIHIHVRVRTYSGSTVLSNVTTQIFFDDTVNNTVMSQSSYSRTTARDTTNNSDMVLRGAANGSRMLATLSGDVNTGYTATITMGLSVQAPAASAPAISSGGIANSLSGTAGVAPGTWISIYGSNLATATRALANSDLVNNQIPTTLGGVSVNVNNQPAYVQYVSPTQVNVLTPLDSSTGSVSVELSNAQGASHAVSTTMQRVLPGLAVASGYVRAVRYPDGVIVNGTGASESGYATVASAKPGDTLALYGTGFGATTPAVEPGLVFSGAYPTNSQVQATIGGVAADVLWAGLVGPGLYQINVTVPQSAGLGDQSVVATIAGVSTQSSAKLKISNTSAESEGRRMLRRFRRAGPDGDEFAWLGTLLPARDA